MNKLLALADRVEKLTGPDREVDMAIGEAVPQDVAWAAFNQGFPCWPKSGWARFTGSLDAAMTLVPEGWTFQCERWREGGASARVNEWNVGDLGGNEAQAGTPELALVAAALRAIEDAGYRIEKVGIPNLKG